MWREWVLAGRNSALVGDYGMAVAFFCGRIFAPSWHECLGENLLEGPRRRLYIRLRALDGWPHVNNVRDLEKLLTKATW